MDLIAKGVGYGVMIVTGSVCAFITIKGAKWYYVARPHLHLSKGQRVYKSDQVRIERDENGSITLYEYKDETAGDGLTWERGYGLKNIQINDKD